MFCVCRNKLRPYRTETDNFYHVTREYYHCDKCGRNSCGYAAAYGHSPADAGYSAKERSRVR